MNNELFTEKEIIAKMRERQKQLAGHESGHGGLKLLAKEISFNYRHIVKVVNGSAALTNSVADAMGYERVVMYRKREK